MKTIKLLTAIIMVMMAMPTFAQDAAQDLADKKFFGGVEVGSVSINGYCDVVYNASVSDCSISNIGFSLFGGYDFNDFFALEVKSMYVDDFNRTDRYARYDDDGSSLSRVIYRVTKATREDFNIGFGVLGRYPINEKIALSGRAGFHHWRSWITRTDTEVVRNVSITSVRKFTNTGIDPYFGMGGSMAIDDKITAHLGYTLYTQSNLDVIHGGLTINF